MNSKPNIILSSRDFDRLDDLLASISATAFPGKTALQAELDRAEVVAPEQMPPSVVTMNSTVRFVMDGTGESFCMTLVYPKDSTGQPDRVSVLAPVGSALLGLSVGDRIEWPRPGGGVIRVCIDDILYQPESAGDFHR
ncbi:regulator of nucleoside diphosphate kinase [Ectothiorhodospira magna]|uniref:Regulator of nucleoside diphosphate kinase n=1 Tax=Ectothiorhodospira magna TaxID=867345 RepID=A0A1H9DCX5_9GAMM|nr:nucleoside diphosphate kinase regulator [Ectothiorhodospira magna]SEQ11326.1 regulator of nucleoside diphosphate kinase [Ectothiorhodospira magna]